MTDPEDEVGSIEDALEALATAQYRLFRAVFNARQRGETWKSIGVRLGVSRQAAHERFSDWDRSA